MANMTRHDTFALLKFNSSLWTWERPEFLRPGRHWDRSSMLMLQIQSFGIGIIKSPRFTLIHLDFSYDHYDHYDHRMIIMIIMIIRFTLLFSAICHPFVLHRPFVIPFSCLGFNGHSGVVGSPEPGGGWAGWALRAGRPRLASAKPMASCDSCGTERGNKILCGKFDSKTLPNSMELKKWLQNVHSTAPRRNTKPSTCQSSQRIYTLHRYIVSYIFRCISFP